MAADQPAAGDGYRLAARVLLLDPAGRVLLLRGQDPARPQVPEWWFTPGGGLEPGETVEDAARREVREETGLEIGDPGAPVYSQRIEFEVDGQRYRQSETFFRVPVETTQVEVAGWTDGERRLLSGYRWWAPGELAATTATIYPANLAELLPPPAGRR